MLNIRDQVYLTIKIDGAEVNGIFIKDLTLAEGNGAYAPTMRLEADDPSSLLSTSRALSEGNTIEVFLAKKPGARNSVARKYRIFGPTRDNNSYNPNLRIIGVLDSPKYFTASARESFTGTSDQVLKQVAGICGLKYAGPVNGRTLNDRQIWLDVCTTRARFIYETTRHGYMDDRSCMESIVTSTHDLLYRNLIDEINTPLQKIKVLFEHSSHPSTDGRTHFIAKEARDRSSAGVMSHWVNYGSTRCNNNIDGYQKDRAAVDVRAPSAYLAINQEVSDMIKRTRFDYAEIDCTNTHKEYQNALYQNKKLLALFTETMSILVNEVTDVKLLDPVIYRQADADPNVKVRNEDVYLVVGKTIVVRGGIHYAERLQLSRISLHIKGQAPLKTSLGSDSFCGSQVGGKSSIISQASINQLNFGTFDSCMSQVSSVASPLNSITQTVNSITSSISALSNPSTALAEIAKLVSSASPEAGSALNGLLSTLTSVSNTVGQLQSSYTSITDTLKSAGANISNLPASVALSSLNKQDGVAGALSTLMQTLSTLNATSNTASYLASSLSDERKASQDGQDTIAKAMSLTYALSNLTTTASSLWNTASSTLSGKTAGATSVQSRSLFDRVFTMLTSGAYGPAYLRLKAQGKSEAEIIKALSLLAAQESLLNTQTNPIWTQPNDYIRAFDSVHQSAESLANIAKNL